MIPTYGVKDCSYVWLVAEISVPVTRGQRSCSQHRPDEPQPCSPCWDHGCEAHIRTCGFSPQIPCSSANRNNEYFWMDDPEWQWEENNASYSERSWLLCVCHFLIRVTANCSAENHCNQFQTRSPWFWATDANGRFTAGLVSCRVWSLVLTFTYNCVYPTITSPGWLKLTLWEVRLWIWCRLGIKKVFWFCHM